MALNKAFGCARVVYNDGIRARKEAYESQLPFISDAQLQKIVITQAKKTPEREWLSEVPSVVLVQALGDLHAAYRNFFNSLKGKRKGPKLGPPKFKKKTSAQSIRFTRNGFRLRKNGRLNLAKIGDIEVRWSRELPSEPSSVTIARDASGRYFASFVVEITENEHLPALDDDAETGIDLGLSTYAVLCGRIIESPKFFRQAERKLRKAQQSLSKKQKGSNNRRKAKLRVAKIHAKVRDQRADFIHKETTRIVRENQAVYVEDLNVKGMTKRFGKSVHDQSLGMFLTTLESKCARYGRYFGKVDRYYPSTQICSSCGLIEGPKGLAGLGIRTWTCSCGATHARDINAEINIRAAGRADRLNACGANVRPSVMKAVGDEAGTRRGAQ